MVLDSFNKHLKSLHIKKKEDKNPILKHVGNNYINPQDFSISEQLDPVSKSTWARNGKRLPFLKKNIFVSQTLLADWYYWSNFHFHDISFLTDQ